MKHITEQHRADAWKLLESIATAGRVRLQRISESSVTIWTLDGLPSAFVTIQIHDLDTLDADYVLRETVGAALQALSRLL